MQAWFAANRQELSRLFSQQLNYKQHFPSDPVRGSCTIELESGDTIATITIWNKGDVCFLRLRKGDSEPVPLDDRSRHPGENIALLLDSYLARLNSEDK